MIGIIDYGMGNLGSVHKAFEHVGAAVTIVRRPGDISGDMPEGGLVLPGVGAFADGMEHLRRGGWTEPIRAFIASGRPFLGICLGMQLLFEGSQEDAPPESTPGSTPESHTEDDLGMTCDGSGGDAELVPGLGILPGAVVRFDTVAADGSRRKVPHMGWNGLRWRRDDPLMRGLDQGASVYFVHGYHAQPVRVDGREVTSCTADYHGWFCASVWRENVWATQFHPEKSQAVGLKMLANFASVREG